MRVVMRGSISGHYVDADGIYQACPQAGETVDVPDEQATVWIEQGMALAEPEQAEDAGAKAPVEQATAPTSGVETATVSAPAAAAKPKR